MKSAKFFYLIFIFAVVVTLCGCTNNNKKYEEALTLYENEKYVDAEELFTSIPGFKDADELAAKCKIINTFEEAHRLYNEKNFEKAEELFKIVVDSDENYPYAKVYLIQCKTLQILREQYKYAVYSLKQKLKNPDSLQVHAAGFEKYTYTAQGNERTCVRVTLDYSAQNGFGGMNREKTQLIGATISDEQLEYFFDNLKYILRDNGEMSLKDLDDIDVSSITTDFYSIY